MTRIGWKSRTARTLAIGGAVVALVAALRTASRLPQRSAAKADAPLRPARSPLAEGVARQCAHHPGLSGVRLLSDSLDAFAARMLLVEAARRTLDLQYYIWHGDRTGTLLLEAVHEAARRGVRVRLLLDDNGISGLDMILAALDRHPNIEVRIFNPFRIRFPKAIGFVTDFARLNRRMHNKSFAADDAVAIIGGRNIGDEYFGAGDGAMFEDLDVLAVGPVVSTVVDDFQRYWDSASAYPAVQILRPVSEAQRERLSRRASIVERDPSTRQYVERVESLPVVQDILHGTLQFEWAEVEMISDDPAKILGDVGDTGLLAGQLEKAVGAPKHELGVICGYFAPGRTGTDQLCAMAGAGVKVSILTNSYAANDVSLVHAGYAPWRKRLLEAGVRLFETAGRDFTPSRRELRKGARLGVGSRLGGTGTGSVAALRAGASTLHAKTFAIDRERLFVGSFNLDPRSIRLNTELGFIIHSRRLSALVMRAFETVIPANSYRLELSDDGRLCWLSGDDEGRNATKEPGMGLFDHALIGAASRLPITWLL